ncbi:MAG: FHA domain-containing protein [Spongiibacteraceae bacterium]|jgi:pSer/pThr/pTyr-binding forkhead associated (FHA) protein|nr:FHA domain-containing protein [Spongiibacteraceae bacterium]
MASLAQLLDDVVVNRFALQGPTTRLGRHPDNDIQIDDLSVSGHHARLIQSPNRYLPDVTDYFVEDLGSTNGTFVNDQRIEGRHLLGSNDVLRLAWNRFKLIDAGAERLEQTAHLLNL